MPYVIRTDGTIEEWSLFDLAALVGPEVNTPDGRRLRWQAAQVGGQWGVVDARRPDRLCLRTENEDAALIAAAEWNVMAGATRDLSRLGIHSFAESLEEAEAEARDLKE